MKKFGIFSLLLCLLVLAGGSAKCDPLADLMKQFSKEYDATKPPSQYSSVNSDYKLGQAALGSIYTTKTLGLLYGQNKQLLEKYDEMLMKYDQLIEQNKQIIDLLSQMVKQKQGKKNGGNN